MRVTQLILITPYLINFGQCKMEPFIIGGQATSILQFPHSAFLYIVCEKNGIYSASMCGSSIVNQHLLLTAAHCTDKCTSNTTITAYVGHDSWYMGASSTAHSYLEHENFSRQLFINDICLVRLKTQIKFSSKVNRVALMKSPPYQEDAIVAGWGRYNVSILEVSDVLKSVTQYVQERDKCPWISLDEGVLCTSSKEGHTFKGDSGSALIVQKYIQIGIVSYGISMPERYSFFTDTGYHYDWIVQKSAVILCSGGAPDPPSTDIVCAMATGREGDECDEEKKT